MNREKVSIVADRSSGAHTTTNVLASQKNRAPQAGENGIKARLLATEDKPGSWSQDRCPGFHGA
jgi:hypothetical protein